MYQLHFYFWKTYFIGKCRDTCIGTFSDTSEFGLGLTTRVPPPIPLMHTFSLYSCSSSLPVMTFNSSIHSDIWASFPTTIDAFMTNESIQLKICNISRVIRWQWRETPTQNKQNKSTAKCVYVQVNCTVCVFPWVTPWRASGHWWRSSPGTARWRACSALWRSGNTRPGRIPVKLRRFFILRRHTGCPLKKTLLITWVGKHLIGQVGAVLNSCGSQLSYEHKVMDSVKASLRKLYLERANLTQNWVIFYRSYLLLN